MGLLLGLGVTNTLKNAVTPVVQVPETTGQKRNQHFPVQHHQLPMLPHHHLLPANRDFKSFPLWPQKPLCVGSLPGSESSSQIHTNAVEITHSHG